MTTKSESENQTQRGPVRLVPWLISGVVLGSLFMYYYDPDRGNYRRARARDKGRHYSLRSQYLIFRRFNDLSHRLKGVSHRFGQYFIGAERDISDERLMLRVRSQFGRLARYPRMIEVHVENGHVHLQGQIYHHEVKDLVACVGRVRGVKAVINELEERTVLQGISGRPKTMATSLNV